MNENGAHGLIFFDGICNLCNHTVQFIIHRDQHDYFRFAALQSETARDQLAFLNPANNHAALKGNQEEFNTIIVLENGKVYYRSTAALRIVRRLGGLWPLLYSLILIPPFIRDFFYHLISKNRYRIWGKQESCMIPSPELKSKFL